jgi:hypothetical protein
MWPIPVVEAQVSLQVLLQLREAPVVRPTKGYAPQLGKNRPLQPLDEVIGPGMTRAAFVGG